MKTKIYDSYQHNGKVGRLVVQSERIEAGDGVEMSGFSFMNYRFKHTAFFHPHDGSLPITLNPYKIRINGKFIV